MCFLSMFSKYNIALFLLMALYFINGTNGSNASNKIHKINTETNDDTNYFYEERKKCYFFYEEGEKCYLKSDFKDALSYWEKGLKLAREMKNRKIVYL